MALFAPLHYVFRMPFAKFYVATTYLFGYTVQKGHTVGKKPSALTALLAGLASDNGVERCFQIPPVADLFYYVAVAFQFCKLVS